MMTVRTAIFVNFIAFAVSSTSGMGALKAIVSFAPAELSHDHLGLNTIGVLYTCFALTALLIARPIMSALTPKWTIVLAMFLISALCAFYTAALNIELITFFMGGDSVQPEPSGSGGVNATSDDDHVPPLEVAFAMTAAVFGGIGAGLFLVASGPQFQSYSASYSESLKEHTKQLTASLLDGSPAAKPKTMDPGFATTLFAGIFACILLVTEMILKGMATFVWSQGPAGHLTIMISYAIVAAACGVCLAYIPTDVDPGKPSSCELLRQKKETEGSGSDQALKVLKNIAGTLALCGKTPLAALLAPRQILFGSMTVLVAFYVTGTIVPATVGLDSVGILTAIVPLVAAVLQVPFTVLSKLKGAKPVIMVIGDISFAMLIVMCLILNMQMTMMEEEAETTTPAANVTTTTTAKMIDDAPMVNIVILYVLQGIGRACFEGANRATYAEFFPAEQLQAAFGTLFVSNALSATVGFYTFARLPIMGLLLALLGWSAVSVGTYLAALCVYTQRAKNEKARTEADGEGGTQLPSVVEEPIKTGKTEYSKE